MKVLLLGGGYTLSRLAEKLPADCFLITSRKEEKVKSFREQGFTAYLLDILNANEVNKFFSLYTDIDIVIDSIPPTENLTGSKNIINALKNYSLKHYIYLSTTGVYGETEGGIVSETSPVKPLSEKALARFKTEKLYQQLKCKLTIFRLSAISGYGRSPLESLRKGKYPYVDHGNRWSNRIEVGDLVEILKKAIAYQPEELPDIINVSDGKWIKTSELISDLCNKHDLPLPRSMTLEEAKANGFYTLLSNQRVDVSLLSNFF